MMSSSSTSRLTIPTDYSGSLSAGARAAAERRVTGQAAASPRAAVDSVPVIAGDASVFEWFGGSQMAAGVSVSPDTAMRTAAVWRCVTLISGAIMSLPLNIYRRTADGGRERADDHPYARLLRDEPNDEMSGAQLIELVTMGALLSGNSYGLIRQARNGTITAIDYYHPDDVRPFRSGISIYYRFTNEDGTTEDHEASYVLHFAGPGRQRRRLTAMSPISYHAMSIGVGIATRDYTAGQFERGLLTNDYFHFPNKLTAEQREQFREYVRQRNQGITNAHNPLILAEGGEWKRLTISAKDAQLLELLKYSSIDIARIFGCPPHMIGEVDGTTSWGTGIEQLGIGFVTYTLRPHLVRFQRELNRKLFPSIGNRRSEYFIEFDPDGLMQGDIKSQGEYFRIALGGNQLPGFMTINEVRRLKNLPPIPGGDEVYRPTEQPAAGPGHNGGPPLDDEDDDDQSQAA
ncbi:phage portal protein [Sphingomonas oleivorans]|nr:phage portal protein [Sphingomonas oleivorans]